MRVTPGEHFAAYVVTDVPQAPPEQVRFAPSQPHGRTLRVLRTQAERCPEGFRPSP